MDLEGEARIVLPMSDFESCDGEISCRDEVVIQYLVRGGLNLVGTTATLSILRKHNSSRHVQPMSVDIDARLLRYTTNPNDFPGPGEYELQPVVTQPGGGENTLPKKKIIATGRI